MAISKWENAARYDHQGELLRTVLSAPGHSLDTLLQLMRSQGEGAIYLSGTRLDNDFCFGSEDVGWLLSVQPEGGEKAAEPGYHPGSTEIYITFQGQLTLECVEDGMVGEKVASAHSVVVLPPGQCHRVPLQAGTAASLIVKTNLRHKPGVIRCGECEQHRDAAKCPLFQRWQAERAARNVSPPPPGTASAQ